MRKYVKSIVLAILAISLLTFIWIKPKTTITSIDESGNVIELNPDSLDKKHKESYKNYGK